MTVPLIRPATVSSQNSKSLLKKDSNRKGHKTRFTRLQIGTMALMSASIVAEAIGPEFLEIFSASESNINSSPRRTVGFHVRQAAPPIMQLATQIMSSIGTFSNRHTSRLDKAISGMNDVASVLALGGLFNNSLQRAAFQRAAVAIGGISSLMSMVGAGMKLEDADAHSNKSLNALQRTDLRMEGIIGMTLGTAGVIHGLTAGVEGALEQRQVYLQVQASEEREANSPVPFLSWVGGFNKFDREANKIQGWRDKLIKYPLLTQTLFRNPIELSNTVIEDKIDDEKSSPSLSKLSSTSPSLSKLSSTSPSSQLQDTSKQ